MSTADGRSSQKGFTILETLLFLTVSAFLFVALLVGTSAAIEQQRYKDGVNSFASFLQTQYNEVVNVSNDRDGAQACKTDASIVADGTTPVQPRGTSECVKLGRLLEVDKGQVKSFDLIGYPPGTTQATSASDIAVLKSYTLKTYPLPDPDSSYELPWGTFPDKVVRSGTTTTDGFFYVLMVHAPRGNTIKLFTSTSKTSPTPVENPAQLIDAANVQEIRTCIGTESVFSGPHLGLNISPSIGGSTGIQVQDEGSAC